LFLGSNVAYQQWHFTVRIFFLALVAEDRGQIANGSKSLSFHRQQDKIPAILGTCPLLAMALSMTGFHVQILNQIHQHSIDVAVDNSGDVVFICPPKRLRIYKNE
jgi:hypothetical protein